MKFLSYGKDGGQDSTVWGWWLVEIKPLFSIALLCFENGSRDAFHSHAFNSYSFVLKGQLMEYVLNPASGNLIACNVYPAPCFVPTPRDCMHQVKSLGRSWVLTFRGPWRNTWKEFWPKTREFVTLTNGRKIIT